MNFHHLCQGVLSGKHYDGALHCHKIILECLERLLLSQYLTSTGEEEVFTRLPEGSKRILDELLKTPSEETLDAAKIDTPMQHYIEGYQQFRESVKALTSGKDCTSVDILHGSHLVGALAHPCSETQ